MLTSVQSDRRAAELERDNERHRDREPDQRAGAQRGQDRERGDAGHRPGDVDRVRLERRHALEQRAERQSERRQQRNDEADDERQDQEVHVGGAALGEAEEDLVGRVDLDVELLAIDECHDAGKQEGERR